MESRAQLVRSSVTKGAGGEYTRGIQQSTPRVRTSLEIYTTHIRLTIYSTRHSSGSTVAPSKGSVCSGPVAKSYSTGLQPAAEPQYNILRLQ